MWTHAYYPRITFTCSKLSHSPHLFDLGLNLHDLWLLQCVNYDSTSPFIISNWIMFELQQVNDVIDWWVDCKIDVMTQFWIDVVKNEVKCWCLFTSLRNESISWLSFYYQINEIAYGYNKLIDGWMNEKLCVMLSGLYVYYKIWK